MDITTVASGNASFGSVPAGATDAEATAAALAHLGEVGRAFKLEPGNVVSLVKEPDLRMLPGGQSVVEQGNLLYDIGAGYLDHLPVIASASTDFGIIDALHTFWDWWSSYTLSLVLMFYGSLDNIVSWGGFVLLIVRLIADGPRAYRTLRDYVNGNKK